MVMDTIFTLNKMRGILLLLILTLSGCGTDRGACVGEGEEEEEAEEHTVSNLPSGTDRWGRLSLLTKASNNSEGCTPTSAEVKIYSTSTSEAIFSFLLENDVNLSNVLAERNDGASFVYFPNGPDQTGLSGMLWLHVPCSSNQECLLVCPAVDSLDSIMSDCQEGIRFTSSSRTVGNYTWLTNSEYSSDDDCVIEIDVENLGTGFGATGECE